MPKISDLQKLGEQSRALGRAMEGGQAEALEERERQQERMAEVWRWQAEKDAVPFEIRDAIVKLHREIAEMRVEAAESDAAARTRSRSMLTAQVASLVVAVMALVAAVILVVDVFW